MALLGMILIPAAWTLLSSLQLAATASACAATAGNPLRTVNTTSGLIIGHAAPNSSDVTEFLGIRYAEPPVGRLRFAPPRRYHAPAGTVYNASSWWPDCLSNKPAVSTFPNFSDPAGFRVWSMFAAQTGNPASEDCLSLNIWTKKPSASAKKPVLIWFHGGRFTIPGPHSPFYNGQYLSAAQDIVVVVPAYRLGILGFSGAPGLPQNAGLRDHRSAIEWVRDNIAGFGGDPERIIISGQSAGGAAVDYYAHAFQDDPIVAGLISHSGTALSFNPNNASYAASLFFNVSGTIGCGTSADNGDSIATDNTTVTDAIISCMRRADGDTLLAAARAAPALPSLALAQATFHPTVDDELVFDDYESRGRAGLFARLPYLLGNTDLESGWYRLSAYAAGRSLSEAQWALFDQRAFTCAVGAQASYRARCGVPTWRYRYHGEWANLRLYNGSAGLGPRGSGAYHGSDVEMVFGTGLDVSLVPGSSREDRASGYMMQAWGAFARDPTGGLAQFGWPGYQEGEESLVRLAVDDDGGAADFVDPGMYDAPCPAVNDPLPGQGAF